MDETEVGVDREGDLALIRLGDRSFAIRTADFPAWRATLAAKVRAMREAGVTRSRLHLDAESGVVASARFWVDTAALERLVDLLGRAAEENVDES